MLEIRGIGISGKKGVGIAHIYQKNITGYHYVAKVNIEDEKKKYLDIKNTAKEEINTLYNEALKDDESSADIFKSHVLLLDDQEIDNYVHNLINQGYDLLSALLRTEEDMKAHFLNMQSEIFRTKVCDIDDVFDRLIQIETGSQNNDQFPSDPFVLICDEIIPSLVYRIPTDLLRGIIVRFGSNCSHGAILARTKNIPVIIRLKNRIDVIKEGSKLIMNGESGAIFVLED